MDERLYTLPSNVSNKYRREYDKRALFLRSAKDALDYSSKNSIFKER
jgi:hypothetical protein